jgi:hypothetical protein
MKKVITSEDSIARAYEEEKKDETIILKNKNNKNHLNPDDIEVEQMRKIDLRGE